MNPVWPYVSRLLQTLLPISERWTMDLSCAQRYRVVTREKATATLYLSRDNPRAQSGHGGDEARWRYTRVMMILEAIHQDGSFLDVGCANGYLNECLERWVNGSGLKVDFYGLDISEELIAFARERRPDRADRFFVGNAFRRGRLAEDR